MSRSIVDTRNCFGCGVCAAVCKKNAIEIILNNDGFYEPRVDTKTCVDCGICSEICSFKHTEEHINQAILSSYAAWSNNNEIRQSCSSGGVAYEISRYLINSGYKVCAVRYNVEKNRVEHYISNNVEDLSASKGSKYLQSYTVDAFSKINFNEKYLIVGTPCQISSFHKTLKKFGKRNNFVLMDFFCHGVPSKYLWDKYFYDVSKSVGQVQNVSWRNKLSGWHNSWALKIIGDRKQITSYWTHGDKFFTVFLSDSCLNKACYDNCRFKYTASYADIRIGDAWGKSFEHDEDGVSIAVAFTKQGELILKESNCTLESRPIEELAEEQMRCCPQRPKTYKKL